MGIQHLLLLLIYLDPLCGLNANKRSKGPPRKSGKVKEVNGTAAPSVIKSTTGTGPGTALPRRITQLSPPTLAGDHDTCLGYYDVSGQYDKEFACNNTDHRYCCGSCFLRFCCPIRAKRLEQRACTNYNTPDWIKTQPPSPAPTGEVYDPALDRTNTTVYIACGVIALIVLLGISAKVAYDKATRPPQEMNVHRALADILRQQGPVPISQYEQENMATVEGSPKESSMKNHYTPIHNKTNHEKPRMNNILTSQTEPYDLSFSRSFQNLTHLPPSYEMAVKADLSKYSSLTSLSDKDFDDFYSRKQQLLSPDAPPRVLGLQSHLLKLSVDSPPSIPHRSQQKPRRVQRAMSQDHVLSPPMPRTPRKHALPSSTSYAPPASPYHARILSQEQLLSADRLQSQDPLLSPDKMLSLRRSNFREKAMSRALSHTDMFMPTTPVMDRHYKMTKMHSHPTSNKNDAEDVSYNTNTLLSVSGAQTANRRQAFASRRTHTVDHLQYIPGHQHHQYRTASKTEVTV
ncbi:protein shisa-6-like isoform X4 [Colossoma macropomum]|uniref:protein shisa-6-like isoform X4 n=1 Tax=Colossoma macropomum TaxID=42526 RepID=UPI001863C044|nr:protein shisa-6-like isoform X4 [Colossoma macropomum]